MTTWFTITASSHLKESGILWRLFGGARPYSLNAPFAVWPRSL